MSERSYDRLFIGGEWVEPHSARAIASIDPATEPVWAEGAEADDTDIDKAVAAAKAAMAGPWRSKITATQRGLLLYKLAELIKRDTARLAELETRDNGKPLRDTISEVQRAIDWLTYRSEEHTSELQSLRHLVCRLLLEKKKKQRNQIFIQGSTYIQHCVTESGIANDKYQTEHIKYEMHIKML